MDEVFLKIVNMSIAASWLILAVIILRELLRKAPKWMNVLLWGIVAVRLLCPFTMESMLSLIPSGETIPLDIGLNTEPVIDSGFHAINHAVNPLIMNSNIPVNGAGVNPLQIMISIGRNIWIAVMMLVILYAAVSYIVLQKKVKASLYLKKNIWLCDEIATPFLLGFWNPKIYIPSGTEEKQMPYIIAHENAHWERRDHWWKSLGFLVLAVHWFNPLVWVAYILLCRDIELACDEKVIRKFGREESIAYSEALLSCSMNKRTILVCPLAFGEVGVKERVRHVLNYKKPAFWIVVVAVVTSLVLAICFLTNPPDNSNPHTIATAVGISAVTDKVHEDNQYYLTIVLDDFYKDEWKIENTEFQIQTSAEIYEQISPDTEYVGASLVVTVPKDEPQKEIGSVLKDNHTDYCRIVSITRKDNTLIDQSTLSVRTISNPSDLLGFPKVIAIVRDEGENEVVVNQGSEQYTELLQLLAGRFPEKIKEAAMALPLTNEDGSYDWTEMAKEFDYIRVSYDRKQTVSLDCFADSNRVPQKVSYSDLIFPLSEGQNDVVIVGTERTFGVLSEAAGIEKFS